MVLFLINIIILAVGSFLWAKYNKKSANALTPSEETQKGIKKLVSMISTIVGIFLFFGLVIAAFNMK